MENLISSIYGNSFMTTYLKHKPDIWTEPSARKSVNRQGKKC